MKKIYKVKRGYGGDRYALVGDDQIKMTSIRTVCDIEDNLCKF